MKLLIIFVFFFFNILAQEAIPDKQFMIGCVGVNNNEVITHSITALGEVWQYNNGSFIQGGIYNSSLITIGNVDTNRTFPNGFNFNWLYYPPYWSLGLYKVTNSKQPDKYFYLDSRNSFFASQPGCDFRIVFNNSESAYKWFNKTTNTWVSISNYELISVGKIMNWPTETNLANFWENALSLVNDNNNKPRLIWGKYPQPNILFYQIFRDIDGTGNFSQIGLVNNNTFEYLDNTVQISQPGQTIYYHIKAFNKLNPTNNVSTSVIPFKIKNDQEPLTISNFELSQNFPNPFNPSTKIIYLIKRKSLVKISVYDILGNEIAVLINSTLEPGKYSIDFDGSNLPSGLYLCTLHADNIVLKMKMLLIK